MGGVWTSWQFLCVVLNRTPFPPSTPPDRQIECFCDAETNCGLLANDHLRNSVRGSVCDSVACWIYHEFGEASFLSQAASGAHEHEVAGVPCHSRARWMGSLAHSKHRSVLSAQCARSKSERVGTSRADVFSTGIFPPHIVRGLRSTN